ncbi:hypothetical protein DN390_13665 [Bacillus sp. SH7-1]|nr:hypothetical protein DN390_13665 [Bacillus sp. SH7-1]
MKSSGTRTIVHLKKNKRFLMESSIKQFVNEVFLILDRLLLKIHLSFFDRAFSYSFKVFVPEPKIV